VQEKNMGGKEINACIIEARLSRRTNRMSMVDAEFKPVSEVSKMMHGFPAQWFVAGGWAIDLFLEFVSRKHEDIEIGIWRHDQNVFRKYLHGWKFKKVDDGYNTRWEEDEWLELPIHEIVARSKTQPPYDLEVLLQEQVDGQWAYRRNMDILCDAHNVVLRSPHGVPYLAPEIVLLFKAKKNREKDDLDFAHVREKLESDRKDWLRNALTQYDPRHKWLTRL
jgi:hypothetical protein